MIRHIEPFEPVFLMRNEKVEIKNDSITQPKLVRDVNNAINSIFKMGTKTYYLKKRYGWLCYL